MAIATFMGEVRGYSVGDDGMVHLAVDEVNHSEEAMFYVQDLQRNFNPGSGSHGFGSRDVPCKIRPGFASYKLALTPEAARDIKHGQRVLVKVDVFNVRKVIYHNRRWAPIPEIRYDLVSICPDNNYSSSESRAAAGSGSRSSSDSRASVGSEPKPGSESKPGSNKDGDK